jgi:hypothetical protein
MEEPKSLDSLFKEKIFRIPDYQRGYAWQREQLKDFWEDLINLSDDRSHYTGVLTLKQISPGEIAESDKEFWLVDDHSYRVYHMELDAASRKSLRDDINDAWKEVYHQLGRNKSRPLRAGIKSWTGTTCSRRKAIKSPLSTFTRKRRRMNGHHYLQQSSRITVCVMGRPWVICCCFPC